MKWKIQFFVIRIIFSEKKVNISNKSFLLKLSLDLDTYKNHNFISLHRVTFLSYKMYVK